MLRSAAALWKFPKPIRPIEFYDRLLRPTDPIPKGIEFTQGGIPPSALPCAQLVQILSLDHAPARQLLTYNMQVAIKAFQRHEADNGSPEVQIAIQTVKIMHLSQHYASARKDFRAQRLLIELVHGRVRSLKHLKRLSLARYFALIEELKLAPEEVAFETAMIPGMLQKVLSRRVQ